MSFQIIKDNESPPFLRYDGQESFFGGIPPLSEDIGYIVLIGFGLLFSVVITGLVFLKNYYGKHFYMTSEYFTTGGRMSGTGLTASTIVCQWTWAATLLQSSNVAWSYGVSGPFWYASGATIQIILFSVLAVAVKKSAPNAHTVCEIVRARWGNVAHRTFLFFSFMTSIIVTSMLLLGGAATVEALTGVDYRVAAFLIPWGVVVYTAAGGLQARFLASYIQCAVIFAILITMIFAVYIQIYSSDSMFQYLKQTTSWTEEECQVIFSRDGNIESTFFESGKYACGPIPRNREGSYITMMSLDGLMFGLINVVGNFGTVFVDQSYWQSAIAARPKSAAKGFVLAGICWFAIPFSLATSVGLASTALQLPINSEEAGAGLVPPAVATELMDQMGSILIMIMVFMAIVSTGSAEAMAVSSLVAYDIYREYYNPNADSEEILFISRLVVVLYCIFMGCFAIILFEVGLNLGWVYLFMGVMIGSAVAPLWNLMTWKKASGTGAVLAAWLGLVLAIISWFVAAWIESGEVSIDALGTNGAMLSGNLVAILSSALIHWGYSTWVDPQDFDFSQLNQNIALVEADKRGLAEDEAYEEEVKEAEEWVSRRAYLLAFLLVVLWPVLAIPARVFTEGYFSFWILVSVAWGFGAATTVIMLPLHESSRQVNTVVRGVFDSLAGRTQEKAEQKENDNDRLGSAA